MMWNALLTCADPSNVYRTPAGSTPDPKVLNPNTLEFFELAPRKTIWDTCGKDVTLVEEEETLNLVGGAGFWPFDNETLDALQEGHELVANILACSNAATAVFAFAGLIKLYTVPALMTPVPVTRQYSFYCWEYAAPLHKDDDNTWSLCCQLWKDGCQDNEYKFAYVEWGVYIQTQANCLWFFNPKHLHITILPWQSSVDTVVSYGTLATVRWKDLAKAILYKEHKRLAEAGIEPANSELLSDALTN
ncbi:hypothetical protein DFH09DRAFT_1074077 [Mycena vulgaris]|nr:hypothetical protein DFH09DRAFT_1074077 [Mycena vulgaris]